MRATLTMPRELACFLVTQASPQSFLLTVAPTLGYLFHCSISKYPFFPETSAALHLKRLLIITVAHTFRELSKLQALF